MPRINSQPVTELINELKSTAKININIRGHCLDTIIVYQDFDGCYSLSSEKNDKLNISYEINIDTNSPDFDYIDIKVKSLVNEFPAFTTKEATFNRVRPEDIKS